MEYGYITENNLENRQYYNYAKIGGLDFLKAYFSNRELAVKGISTQVNPELVMNQYFQVDCCKKNDTGGSIVLKDELTGLLAEFLHNSGAWENSKIILDKIVKTFEVRKRLYQLYNESFKPIDENDYHDSEIYLICASVLVYAYQKNEDLKYLNALLKLNDTLISIKNTFILQKNDDMISLFLFCINKEVYFVNQLIDRKRNIQEDHL